MERQQCRTGSGVHGRFIPTSVVPTAAIPTSPIPILAIPTLAISQNATPKTLPDCGA